MELKKDTLYISFHKPKGLVGYLIALRTFGKYSHCEFIYNNEVYLANPGGVRKKVYLPSNNTDIFEKVYAYIISRDNVEIIPMVLQ